MLPFVIFAGADGRFLEGSSGGVIPAQFVPRSSAWLRRNARFDPSPVPTP
jgi:hypothetical protein